MAGFWRGQQTTQYPLRTLLLMSERKTNVAVETIVARQKLVVLSIVC
jgi:hypothetical protein